MDEFENKLVFDDESIFDMTLNVYWLKNKNNQISQLADLRGSSIIMTRSHDYFGFRGMIANKASANILFARGVVNGLDMLSADRADYLLSYDIFAENYQKQHDVQFEFLSLEKFEFLLAVHRSVPDAENLLSSLSKTLKEMKLNGKVDKFLATPYKPTNN